MSTIDPSSSVRPADPVPAEDHCLVHHFIRAHGRRPTAVELAELRSRTTVVRPARPRRVTAAPGLAVTLRREVARLLHRL